MTTRQYKMHVTLLMIGLFYFQQAAQADPIGSIQNISNYLVTGVRACATIPWCMAGWHYFFGKGDKAQQHVQHAVIGSVVVFGVAGIISLLQSKIQN